MTDRRRISAVVRGRVQGVGYRYFTRAVAVDLELVGWVRNLPDGSVELEAEGASTEIEEFLIRLGAGPPVSRVDRIDQNELAPVGGDEFDVRF